MNLRQRPRRQDRALRDEQRTDDDSDSADHVLSMTPNGTVISAACAHVACLQMISNSISAARAECGDLTGRVNWEAEPPAVERKAPPSKCASAAIALLLLLERNYSAEFLGFELRLGLGHNILLIAG